MTKILLVGCRGKMGKSISELVEKSPDISIASGIDAYNNSSFNYPVFKNIQECDIEADVILDFSRPNSLEGLLAYSTKNKLPIVLCSTGYTDEQITAINNFSAHNAVFRSGNMSIGINVVNNILKTISAVLYENFDIEIIEKHHNQKVDAPSGTALLLGDTIKNAIAEETKYVHGRSGIAKREHSEIGVHAIRGGSIIGEHEVIFAGQGETIEIKHTAISRDVFASGALKACEFMQGKEKGLYNMDDVLRL